MSFNVEGVLLRGGEDEVIDFFCRLPPRIPLRLIRVDGNDGWGIYTAASSGGHPELAQIAQSASIPFRTALYYGFFSVPCAYACQFFDRGQLTHQQHDDPTQHTWPFQNNVEPLGLDDGVDWDRELENLFRGGKGGVVLEH